MSLDDFKQHSYAAGFPLESSTIDERIGLTGIWKLFTNRHFVRISQESSLHDAEELYIYWQSRPVKPSSSFLYRDLSTSTVRPLWDRSLDLRLELSNALDSFLSAPFTEGSYYILHLTPSSFTTYEVADLQSLFTKLKSLKKC